MEANNRTPHNAVSFKNFCSFLEAKRFFQTRSWIVTFKIRAFNSVAAACNRRLRVIER